MNSFGISYDEIKKYPQAELYYLKCILLNPKYHMAYYNLGILYKAQGKIEKTIEYYKKAV
jgi:tetratricopeptide (TPR) repeat protein